MSWDYARTAVERHHTLGSLADVTRESDEVRVHLRVPQPPDTALDRINDEADEAAAWLFDHTDLDRVRYEIRACDGREETILISRRRVISDA